MEVTPEIEEKINLYLTFDKNLLLQRMEERELLLRCFETNRDKLQEYSKDANVLEKDLKKQTARCSELTVEIQLMYLITEKKYGISKIPGKIRRLFTRGKGEKSTDSG